MIVAVTEAQKKKKKNERGRIPIGEALLPESSSFSLRRLLLPHHHHLRTVCRLPSFALPVRHAMHARERARHLFLRLFLRTALHHLHSMLFAHGLHRFHHGVHVLTLRRDLCQVRL